MPNMIFTGLCCNTKHISASQYSCRDSITCSEKTLFQFKNIEKAESLIKLQKKLVSQKIESELNLLKLKSGEQISEEAKF